MKMVSEFERLSTRVVPVNYALTLKPNLDSFRFDGELVVDVEVNTNKQSKINHK
jgi:hypothetical protein